MQVRPEWWKGQMDQVRELESYGFYTRSLRILKCTILEALKEVNSFWRNESDIL